jgi:Icc-related predicted phosphoesterase
MKVVHFSDWHGARKLLPPADLYICTGDMLPNYPLVKFENIYAQDSDRQFVWCDPLGLEPGATKHRPKNGIYCGRKLWPAREMSLQTQWVMQQVGMNGNVLRHEILGEPDAPVIVCRGNHDFINLALMFGGDVWEVSEKGDEVTTIKGFRIGGARGVNPISGEWSDEVSDVEMEERCCRIPRDIDILVTHTPPRGIMDYGGDHYGNASVMLYCSDRKASDHPLRLHCFGHVHEEPGIQTDPECGTIYSNAACTFKEIVL